MAVALPSLHAAPSSHRTLKPGATGLSGQQGKAEATAAIPEPVKPHKPGDPSPASLQGDVVPESGVPHPDGKQAHGNRWDKINAAANLAPMAFMLPGMMPGSGGAGGSGEARKAKHDQEKAEKESRYHQALGAADQAKSAITGSMISNI
jgi:hypothetical protein